MEYNAEPTVYYFYPNFHNNFSALGSASIAK